MLARVSAAIIIPMLLLAGTLAAHEGATGIVKKRMDGMIIMRDQTRKVADMFKGKAVFNSKEIESAAILFVQHGKRIPQLFPETRESQTLDHSEALPLIWLQWDDFKGLSDRLVIDSEALKKLLADTRDQSILKKAFFDTTRSCSGCHKKYRKTRR